MRYLRAKINEEDLWQGYQSKGVFASGTGWRYVKTDAPQELPKYKEEATIPDWITEIRYPQKANIVRPLQSIGEEPTGDDLDMLIYGTTKLKE